MQSSKTVDLSEVKVGDEIIIKRLQLTGFMRRRLMDLGFLTGVKVKVLQKSPLGDPVAFYVNHTIIALRKEESSQIIGEVIHDGK
ncbi:FeoA family protein [Bacillus massilinigeriensis]|uniref:FeoA family protein n=1 Tax=Bacillus massilionigeriensis TaxID=1805475 RepID=UPI000BEAB812